MRWYEVFIAHAGGDRHFAEKLYYALSARHEVFLDSKSLLPGDRWDEVIPIAQRQARASLVIVSTKTDNAYFEREEIASAIDLSRQPDNNHRVVPIYLNCEIVPNGVPYGLRILHGIHWNRRRAIEPLVAQLESLLRRRPTRPIRLGHLSRREQEALEEKRRALRRTKKQLARLITKAATHRASFSLIFADIDGFEQINRKHGQATADRVIEHLGAAFSAVLRDHYHDRIYGDQFLACVQHGDRQAGRIADELRERVSSYPWHTIDPKLYVKMSLGVSEHKDDEPTDNWLIRAMLGAQHAKSLGGDRVCFGPFDLPLGVGEPEDHLS
jgi:diguanylate cyclase (GGDEF)-like protein